MGVEIIELDLNDPEACSRVLIDAYGAFAVTSRWQLTEENERKQAKNLVDSARERNVQHFIAHGLPEKIIDLSLPTCRNKTSVLQNYIRQLPMEARFPLLTYLHSGFYYQNFITFFVPDSVELTFRYPDMHFTRLPTFDLYEIGSIVHQCFLHPQRWGQEQTLSIAAERLSMEEICDAIRKVAKRDVRFVALTYEQARQKLHRQMVDDLQWYEDNELCGQEQPLTDACPTMMKTFLEWLKENQWMME